MNSDQTNNFQKDKITVNQMWSLIEDVLSPCGDVPDRTKMNEKQIVKLYSIVKEADELFRMLGQIAELKKEIGKLTRK